MAGEDPLDRLDRLAQAAWRRGDLRRAERLFGELADRAGRGHRAELAYGELFVLAHQMGHPRRMRRYFRAYLRRFPRGRFAEDARAGLCRVERGEAERACWKGYLEAHPRGAHAAEARRVLAKETGG